MFNYRRPQSKYRNEKVEQDGVFFDSKGERDRYLWLKMQQKAGFIKNLQIQVSFELQPTFKKRGKTHRAINYVADFVYEEDGITIVEDFKGFKNEVYRLKQKLFEYKYPTHYIRETNAKTNKKTLTKVRTYVTKADKPGNKEIGGQLRWK